MEHAHDVHSSSYLWQTVKCYADVSVMSLEYRHEQEAFNAKSGVVKQCRQFNVIRNRWESSQNVRENWYVTQECYQTGKNYFEMYVRYFRL